MVEQSKLNTIFKSLSDPTRRDILARVYDRQHTISELAAKYNMSFAATAKHVTVLENADLIIKSKIGKEQVITINGKSFEQANQYLQKYALLWSDRFDRLEQLLKTNGGNKHE